MSIASEVTRISGNVDDAFTACANKGATMPQTRKSDYLADTISSIPEGGGVPVRNSLNLYDWEGTLLKSYSYAEAQALESLPQSSGVTHELMTFQEWNWSLADIKTWLTAHPHGQLDVCAIYTTTNGSDYSYWDNPRLTDNTLISMQKRGSISGYGSSAFENRKSLEYINIPYGVTSFGRGCFGVDSSLKFIGLPSSFERFTGSNCFFEDYRLYKIILPNGVKGFYSATFDYTGIVDIVIPDSVTTFGSNITSMFRGCYTLKKIILSNALGTIPAKCFFSCTALPAISVPPSVVSIGNNAFDECKALNDIVIEGKPSLASETFSSCPSTVRFYAYRENLSYFQSATNWSTYYDKFVAIEDYTDYLNSIGIDLQRAS